MRNQPISKNEAYEVADVLATLNSPARLHILSQLAHLGECSEIELARAGWLTQPTTHHHLKVLLDGGLVSRREEGVYRFYWLSEDGRALVDRIVHGVRTR